MSIEAALAPGMTFGRDFRIVRALRAGGMGTVYIAEQKEPVRRRVALKVIKLGMDSKQVLARFEAERQALALMEHSNIAKVFEAGTTERGPVIASIRRERARARVLHCGRWDLANERQHASRSGAGKREATTTQGLCLAASGRLRTPANH